MQGDVTVSAQVTEPSLWTTIWSIPEAIWAILHPVLATVDPLCGPVGIFSLFFRNGVLSCSPEGWGDEIASGFYVTAGLAVCTLPFGLIAGLFLALAKQSEAKQLRTAADIYTTIFRGLPELLTLFIIYYGLQIVLQNLAANLGYTGAIEVNAFVAGMIAIGMVFSAYCSELLQSAFKAIPRGQYEGGYAVGLTNGQTMRLVILPQLLRIALPGLGNLWMVLLKDTALVSVIGLPDILRQTGVAAKVTKQAFFFYGLSCVLFLVLAILSSFVISWLERQTKRAEVRR